MKDIKISTGLEDEKHTVYNNFIEPLIKEDTLYLIQAHKYQSSGARMLNSLLNEKPSNQNLYQQLKSGADCLFT